MFPRLGTLFIWIARPTMFNEAFNGSWLWPILGIIFLPFTTLMYVILSWGVGVVNGWDWFWIAMAVVIDLMHWSSNVYQNRERIPGYTPPPASPVA
jgi:hypothetical protein